MDRSVSSSIHQIIRVEDTLRHALGGARGPRARQLGLEHRHAQAMVGEAVLLMATFFFWREEKQILVAAATAQGDCHSE
jgi:hypothetical protein